MFSSFAHWNPPAPISPRFQFPAFVLAPVMESTVRRVRVEREHDFRRHVWVPAHDVQTVTTRWGWRLLAYERDSNGTTLPRLLAWSGGGASPKGIFFSKEEALNDGIKAFTRTMATRHPGDIPKELCVQF